MDNNKNTFSAYKPVLIFGTAVLFVMSILSLWAWQRIPAGTEIPVHWGPDGQPDRYGNKFLGLLMLPIVVVAIMFLRVVVPKLEPRRRHMQYSLKTLNIIIGAIILTMAVFHLMMILNVTGKIMDIRRGIVIALGLLFIVIGNYMGKMRSTFTLGIKTPWTLTSEKSWLKTHRLGGGLFTILGMIIIISCFINCGLATFIILIAGVLLILIATFTYSYIIWKQDPDKAKHGR